MERSFIATGKKVLASAVSAAMVIAFTPVVAFGGQGDPVATIGDTSYTSLNDAISAANSTEGTQTVVLQKDTSSSDSISISDSLVLDLNGHAITNGVENQRLFEFGARGVSFEIDGTKDGSSMVIPDTNVRSFGFIRTDYPESTITVTGGTFTGDTDNASLITTRYGSGFYEDADINDSSVWPSLSFTDTIMSTNFRVFDLRIGNDLAITRGSYSATGGYSVSDGKTVSVAILLQYYGIKSGILRNVMSSSTVANIEAGHSTILLENCDFRAKAGQSHNVTATNIGVSAGGYAEICGGTYSIEDSNNLGAQSTGAPLWIYGSGGTIVVEDGEFTGVNDVVKVDSQNGASSECYVMGGTLSGTLNPQSGTVLKIYEGAFTDNPLQFRSGCSAITQEGEKWLVTHPKESLVHNEEWSTPASCITTGSDYSTCPEENCEFIYYKLLPLADHTWGEYVTTIEPTTSSEGVATSTCSVCQATQTKPIPKLNPPYIPDPAPVAPPAPSPEVGDKGSTTLPSTPGDSGTAGSTKVDVTVTDNTAATDSKGNKVDGSVSIDKIETTSTAVAIPETITTDKGTFLVTSIPAGAMEGNSTAATVAIPESVTTIGEGAFSNCTALTTVTVPAGVTEIAFGTFAGCTSLETVEIQGEVTQIASNAFSGCESLSSVTIPETVTTIGSGAFSGCSNLTSASIPAGVATIEANTFAGCSNLTSVEVKGELTEIAADAFNGCESLTSMTVAGTVRPLAVGTRAASSALVIPASVTKIGDRAFKGTGITSVTVPAGVKMGTGVFRDCKQLTKAAVASKVKAISAYTFKGCSALKSVTIPGTVTKIERSAFSGCKSLAKVTIPKSVTSIGKNALYGASKVKTLTVNSKKLTKSSVKGALAGSKVTTVKVPKSMLKSYAKVFAKSVVGKTVKVRAI